MIYLINRNSNQLRSIRLGSFLKLLSGDRDKKRIKRYFFLYTPMRVLTI